MHSKISKMNTPRLLLLFFRVLQCFASLIIIITDILRHNHIINLIESENKIKPNSFELLYGYLVMNLGCAVSVLHILRINGQCLKLGSYKFDIIIDCLLMNAWMIFGILRLSPQFDDSSFLTCSQYDPNKRIGCFAYITTVTLGYLISASYFLTSMVSTWICTANSANNNVDDNNFNSRNYNFPKSTSNRAELNESNEIRNSQTTDNISTIREGENKNSEIREVSLKEFLEHNKHLTHLLNGDSELNMTDGTFVLHKPSPGFLRYESPSRNSSLYSLDSSFSRIYGSIIISRKQNELDTNNSSGASRNGSFIVSGNPASSRSDKSISILSDKTSRSSKYDGSIIIKLV